MRSYQRATLGIMMIVIVIVIWIGALVILDVYSVEAGAPGNISNTRVDEVNGYPPPEPDLCPEPYPPPYQPPYPEPCLYEYLPLLIRQ